MGKYLERTWDKAGASRVIRIAPEINRVMKRSKGDDADMMAASNISNAAAGN